MFEENDDRHSWPDGGTNRQRGGRGSKQNLSEGSKAEALGQAEEVRRMEEARLWEQIEVELTDRVCSDLPSPGQTLSQARGMISS